jgi:hypothetical protein
MRNTNWGALDGAEMEEAANEMARRLERAQDAVDWDMGEYIHPVTGETMTNAEALAQFNREVPGLDGVPDPDVWWADPRETPPPRAPHGDLAGYADGTRAAFLNEAE